MLTATNVAWCLQREAKKLQFARADGKLRKPAVQGVDRKTARQSKAWRNITTLNMGTVWRMSKQSLSQLARSRPSHAHTKRQRYYCEVDRKHRRQGRSKCADLASCHDHPCLKLLHIDLQQNVTANAWPESRCHHKLGSPCVDARPQFHGGLLSQTQLLLSYKMHP